MAKAGANYLPINQYTALYSFESTSTLRNKENSPRIALRSKSPQVFKMSLGPNRSKSPHKFKF